MPVLDGLVWRWAYRQRRSALKLKIRDAHASVEGDFSTIPMPSGGLEVIGEDGRTLFTIKLQGGALQVTAGMVCKVDGVLFDDKLSIIPHSSNCVFIERPKYVPK